MTKMKSICVFCGSSIGTNPVFAEAARVVGQELVARSIRLVYGGGNVGLMGIVADAVMQAGGCAVGVIPEALVGRELAHRGLTELRVVRSMHERKALMAELADGFVALPGGFGTLDELCEIVTWAQLGLHRKPCGLLNVDRFFESFLAQTERAVRDQFIRPEHAALVQVDAVPGALLDRMEAYCPPDLPKWINRNQS
jgi:uncharacterized protein (TIGR00730 family)